LFQGRHLILFYIIALRSGDPLPSFFGCRKRAYTFDPPTHRRHTRSPGMAVIECCLSVGASYDPRNKELA